MGQEERKNKAKMEKTQIQLASTSNEYEAAVKTLEETIGRWNRDWKMACDVWKWALRRIERVANMFGRNSRTWRRNDLTLLRAVYGLLQMLRRPYVSVTMQ